MSARAVAAATAAALLSLASSCDVCDGLAAAKRASGEVLDISHEGLRRLVTSHEVVALLLYRTWDERSRLLQRAYDDAAAALHGEGVRLVMAQIDAGAEPSARLALRVAPTELPAIRILRGDPSFGYALAGGISAAAIAAQLRDEHMRGLDGASVVELVDAAGVSRLEGWNETWILAEGLDEQAATTFEAVAHAFAGAVKFALRAGGASAGGAIGRKAGAAPPQPPSPPKPSSPSSPPPCDAPR